MSTQCNFKHNKPSAVYYSGEVISGTITLNTIKDKTVRNVRIVFLGEAKVKWSESYSTTNSTSTTDYTSHIVYINNATLVHGEGVLPRGLHTYTFSINLPWECPSSCEGKYGKIRYGISLIIDRPYRFDNVFQNPLTVVQTVDLNSNPVFKIPVVAEEIGYLHWCTCSDGKLLYALSIPFGAYAPGQLVKYALRIQNQALTDTNGYSLVFSQKQTFIAHSPSREERHKKTILVQQDFQERCLRLSTHLLEGQFRIPSVPPSTIDPNAIIKLEYKLKVTVYLSGCHSNTVLRIPIIIGTIPIEIFEPAIEAAPQAEATAPKLEMKDLDSPPSYKEGCIATHHHYQQTPPPC